MRRAKGSTKPVSDTSRINQLQAENRKLKSELESIRHEKESTWQSTESQYLQEIQDLKATIRIQNEMLSSRMSELDRVKDENDSLNANLDSLKDSLVEKQTDIDELKSQVLVAENQMSLTELRHDDLKKSITDSLQANQELKALNQELIADRDNADLTALNSAQLADEQVAALSEALSTLQEAVSHSKEATSYENTAEHLRKDGPTKTKGNWMESGLPITASRNQNPIKKVSKSN
jgi:chromosome segregation ATPase